ncbi:hypothetical protein XELAEV_18025483mg [Xenopus laevis]|uniref:GIY-YIG domain-containing protein n=1 Tax=Xenopus laevis TaxID=8355 RepID=A0A974D0V7_XENLA|nr:hypothetical protein XELAEV_18025483mg [Xenopus laevis]
MAFGCIPGQRQRQTGGATQQVRRDSKSNPCRQLCEHLFREPPRFSYKRGSTLKDLLSPTEPRQEALELKNKLGTFPCYNCNCCTSIIKGPNIHHPTKGTEIPLKTFATCSSTHVVYTLKCPCGMMYIGKTIRSVNTRIKEHKNTIRNFALDTYTDTSVSRHFSEAKHHVSQLKWKVLEVVKRPQRGGNWDKLLLQREAWWIEKMDSTKPLGMNDFNSLKCFL